MSRGERGAALVAVVLVTLALFAIGHGLLELSLGELAASRAAVRLLEARAAAESSVRLAMGDPNPTWLDSISVGGERALIGRVFGRAQGSASARRLSRESWWVEGLGRAGTAEASSAQLSWAMDPLSRVRALRGAISIGSGSSIALAGTVDATAPVAVDPPLAAADCEPWLADLSAVYSLEPLAPVAVLMADTLPSLGLLDFADLLDAADVAVSGSVSPTPVEASGACATEEPSNWGDPERRWRACADHFPLRKSVGSLHVDGGVGQGVLIVDGDLELDGAARFYGLVLASGELRVTDGAQLIGMAVATGGADVGADGLVRASACWVMRALTARRMDLGRLEAMPGQGTLGPL